MPRSILLVDDDADAREIFGSALSQAGYRVLLAVHGAEGVYLARRHQPSLILMDLRMPLMDGRSSMEYLRSDPSTRNIPVWALSAYLEEEEAKLGSEIHFSRLLAKPLQPDELVRAVGVFFHGPKPDTVAPPQPSME